MLQVTKGWHGFKEVNRVVYDPEKVTVEQMAGWLREAGTYRGVIAEEGAAGEKGDGK